MDIPSPDEEGSSGLPIYFGSKSGHLQSKKHLSSNVPSNSKSSNQPAVSKSSSKKGSYQPSKGRPNYPPFNLSTASKEKLTSIDSSPTSKNSCSSNLTSKIPKDVASNSKVILDQPAFTTRDVKSSSTGVANEPPYTPRDVKSNSKGMLNQPSCIPPDVPSNSKGMLNQPSYTQRDNPSNSKGILNQPSYPPRDNPSNSKGMANNSSYTPRDNPSNSKGMLKQPSYKPRDEPSNSKSLLNQPSYAPRGVPFNSKGMLNQPAFPNRDVPSNLKGMLNQQSHTLPEVPSSSKSMLNQPSYTPKDNPANSKRMLDQLYALRENPSNSKSMLNRPSYPPRDESSSSKSLLNQPSYTPRDVPSNSKRMLNQPSYTPRDDPSNLRGTQTHPISRPLYRPTARDHSSHSKSTSSPLFNQPPYSLADELLNANMTCDIPVIQQSNVPIDDSSNSSSNSVSDTHWSSRNPSDSNVNSRSTRAPPGNWQSRSTTDRQLNSNFSQASSIPNRSYLPQEFGNPNFPPFTSGSPNFLHKYGNGNSQNKPHSENYSENPQMFSGAPYKVHHMPNLNPNFSQIPPINESNHPSNIFSRNCPPNVPPNMCPIDNINQHSSMNLHSQDPYHMAMHSNPMQSNVHSGNLSQNLHQDKSPMNIPAVSVTYGNYSSGATTPINSDENENNFVSSTSTNFQRYDATANPMCPPPPPPPFPPLGISSSFSYNFNPHEDHNTPLMNFSTMPPLPPMPPNPPTAKILTKEKRKKPSTQSEDELTRNVEIKDPKASKMGTSDFQTKLPPTNVKEASKCSSELTSSTDKKLLDPVDKSTLIGISLPEKIDLDTDSIGLISNTTEVDSELTETMKPTEIKTDSGSESTEMDISPDKMELGTEKMDVVFSNITDMDVSSPEKLEAQPEISDVITKMDMLVPEKVESVIKSMKSFSNLTEMKVTVPEKMKLVTEQNYSFSDTAEKDISPPGVDSVIETCEVVQNTSEKDFSLLNKMESISEMIKPYSANFEISEKIGLISNRHKIENNENPISEPIIEQSSITPITEKSGSTENIDSNADRVTKRHNFPCLGKEAAKKRLKSFSANKSYFKDKMKPSPTIDDSEKKKKLFPGENAEEDKKDLITKKKKKKEKISFIEQIRDEETRLKVALGVHNVVLGSLNTTELTTIPAFLKDLEAKKKELEAKRERNGSKSPSRSDRKHRDRDRKSSRSGNQDESKYRRSRDRDDSKYERSKDKSKDYSKERDNSIDNKSHALNESGKKKIKEMPKSWQEIRKLNLTIDDIKKLGLSRDYLSRSRSSSISPTRYNRRDDRRDDRSDYRRDDRSDYNRSRSRDRNIRKKDKYYPFPYIPKYLISLQAKGAFGHDLKSFKGSMVQKTTTKPSLPYCINSSKFKYHYWNYKELMMKNKSKPEIKAILEDFFTHSSYDKDKSDSERNNQPWYSSKWSLEQPKFADSVPSLKEEAKSEISALDYLSTSYEGNNAPPLKTDNAPILKTDNATLLKTEKLEFVKLDKESDVEGEVKDISSSSQNLDFEYEAFINTLEKQTLDDNKVGSDKASLKKESQPQVSQDDAIIKASKEKLTPDHPVSKCKMDFKSVREVKEYLTTPGITKKERKRLTKLKKKLKREKRERKCAKRELKKKRKAEKKQKKKKGKALSESIPMETEILSEENEQEILREEMECRNNLEGGIQVDSKDEMEDYEVVDWEEYEEENVKEDKNFKYSGEDYDIMQRSNDVIVLDDDDEDDNKSESLVLSENEDASGYFEPSHTSSSYIDPDSTSHSPCFRGEENKDDEYIDDDYAEKDSSKDTSCDRYSPSNVSLCSDESMENQGHNFDHINISSSPSSPPSSPPCASPPSPIHSYSPLQLDDTFAVTDYVPPSPYSPSSPQSSSSSPPTQDVQVQGNFQLTSLEAIPMPPTESSKVDSIYSPTVLKTISNKESNLIESLSHSVGSKIKGSKPKRSIPILPLISSSASNICESNSSHSIPISPLISSSASMGYQSLQAVLEHSSVQQTDINSSSEDQRRSAEDMLLEDQLTPKATEGESPFKKTFQPVVFRFNATRQSGGLKLLQKTPLPGFIHDDDEVLSPQNELDESYHTSKLEKLPFSLLSKLSSPLAKGVKAGDKIDKIQEDKSNLESTEDLYKDVSNKEYEKGKDVASKDYEKGKDASIKDCNKGKEPDKKYVSRKSPSPLRSRNLSKSPRDKEKRQSYSDCKSKDKSSEKKYTSDREKGSYKSRSPSRSYKDSEFKDEFSSKRQSEDFIKYGKKDDEKFTSFRGKKDQPTLSSSDCENSQFKHKELDLVTKRDSVSPSRQKYHSSEPLSPIRRDKIASPNVSRFERSSRSPVRSIKLHSSASDPSASYETTNILDPYESGFNQEQSSDFSTAFNSSFKLDSSAYPSAPSHDSRSTSPYQKSSYHSRSPSGHAKHSRGSLYHSGPPSPDRSASRGSPKRYPSPHSKRRSKSRSPSPHRWRRVRSPPPKRYRDRSPSWEREEGGSKYLSKEERMQRQHARNRDFDRSRSSYSPSYKRTSYSRSSNSPRSSRERSPLGDYYDSVTKGEKRRKRSPSPTSVQREKRSHLQAVSHTSKQSYIESDSKPIDTISTGNREKRLSSDQTYTGAEARPIDTINNREKRIPSQPNYVESISRPIDTISNREKRLSSPQTYSESDSMPINTISNMYVRAGNQDAWDWAGDQDPRAIIDHSHSIDSSSAERVSLGLSMNKPNLRRKRPSLSPEISPKRLSLDERLKQEHGVELEEQHLKTKEYDSPSYFWDYNSSPAQMSQPSKPSGNARVIRVGNVLQVLPQESSPEKPSPPPSTPEHFPLPPAPKIVQAGNVIQVVPTDNFQGKDSSKEISEIITNSGSRTSREDLATVQSGVPMAVSSSSLSSINPMSVIAPVPPPSSMVASSPLALISSLLASSMSKPIIKPEVSTAFTGLGPSPLVGDSSSVYHSAVETTHNVPSPSLVQEPSPSSVIHDVSTMELDKPVNNPLPCLDTHQQATIISAAVVAAASGVSASNLPIAHLISVLQQVKNCQSFFNQSQPVIQPVDPQSAEVQSAADCSVPPPQPVEEFRPQIDIETFKQQRRERKERKRHEREIRRKARKEKLIKRKMEQERREEQEKREEQEREEEMLDEDEIALKEAISEVPELGSPIPEYEIYNEDDDGDEDDDDNLDKPRVIPLPLPPPEKGILISPSFRILRNYQRKSVSFADGVMPGDGTSPSGGEEIHSPPPPNAQPEKKKEKKLRKKKKVKVKAIKQYNASENRMDSPPPPPELPPEGGVLTLYPGCTHYTCTEPGTFVIYTQQSISRNGANPHLVKGGMVTIPPGMLIHSSALSKGFSSGGNIPIPSAMMPHSYPGNTFPFVSESQSPQIV